MAELYRWPLVRQWGPTETDRLIQRLKQYTLLPYDEATCWHWAQIAAIKGHPISYHDAWIAATALRYDLPLVTHNRGDFEHIPRLALISEA